MTSESKMRERMSENKRERMRERENKREGEIYIVGLFISSVVAD